MKFKPRSGEKEIISFRIPKDLLCCIDALASENSLSRNEFMVQCLDYAINNLEASEQTNKTNS